MYNITNTWSAIKRPEAFITKAKKRIKQFDGQVYLSDGDEYEIELYNPTTDVVLAKIKLDGNYIAGGGIVLRRGERVFLERYLDSPNKFKFTTYEVNGKNIDVQEAIANNGYVEIEFYSEYKLFMSSGSNITTFSSNPITWTNTTGAPYIGNPTYTTSNLSVNTNAFYNASLTSGVSDIQTSNTIRKAHLTDRKVETGTTEMGGDSEQTFKHTNKTFNSYSFYNVAWKILPNSQKQYTAEEVNVNYCGNCGAKRKKSSFKFCPHCGTQF
jgi:hypothetical protein